MIRFLTGILPYVCALSLSQVAPNMALNTACTKPTLTGRVELEEHDKCFTIKYFIKNEGTEELEVVYGRGGSGLEVVPSFELGAPRYLQITPPKYLTPPRRSMKLDAKKVRAGEEILYGSFTLGYPPSITKEEVDLTASILFGNGTSIPASPAVRLRIPAQAGH